MGIASVPRPLIASSQSRPLRLGCRSSRSRHCRTQLFSTFLPQTKGLGAQISQPAACWPDLVEVQMGPELAAPVGRRAQLMQSRAS